MLQVLLGSTPTNQGWSPTDLSECVFWNAEATDDQEDLIGKLNILGTSGDSTRQAPIEKTSACMIRGPVTQAYLSRMRTLHDIRRDWLSDKELWLAIPEGEIKRHCFTHAPRNSWKIMVKFFLALYTNVGSWIRNLERRDMMLLGSMAENIFGFAGTYARQKQASLALILTGWKRWVEMHSKIDTKTPKIGWFLNLLISGSIVMNKVGKTVSRNIGPHGYKGSKEEVHKIFEQGTPILCLQDVRIPKRRKNSFKRELQCIFPHYWIYITTSQSPQKDSRNRPYIFSVLTALHSSFLPKVMQVRCRHPRLMKPEILQEIDGRLSVTQGRTPKGTTFQIMNIY